ncbi:hypothetical protein MGLY_03180 [Neomoorella glycerini]|uniref:HEPN domain protein n=1 Tax=Neomoorella glycerini TaxID=55779 RepID=A0A6I5ZN10_9FIRM|nr:hypothetical protein [Moorella glycerini]QGP90995.1 hypothetical protein MGLY_03180 [Moorella glycerini]
MRVEDHIAKAKRIEDTMMQKLDLKEDYETVIENCMLAGTHLLNAVLHKLGITEDNFDLLHSDKPKLDRQVDPEVAEIMAAMKYIEDLRPYHVRGVDPWQPEKGEKCLLSYRKVKEFTERVL